MSFINGIPGAVAQGLIWGIMAIGVYITFKILDIADLTVDGSICTGAAVSTMLIINGVNVWIALICAIVAGMLCGLITGLFHTLLGIPAILSGILTQLMLWSINLTIQSSKANISVAARNYDVILSQLKNYQAIITLTVISVIIIALLYWFFGTEFGCGLRATGCNISMSRAQGINTSFNKVFGLAISNGIVALSGALLSQYQGASDINMGRGAIVIGLAAVIIGEALLSRIAKNFAFRLLSVIIGGIVYYIVLQGVISLGFDSNLLKMITALVVGLFLGIPHLKSTYFNKSRRKKEVQADA